MIDEPRVDFAMLSGDSDAFGSLRVLPLYQWDRVVLVPRNQELADLEKRRTLETLPE